MNAQDSNGLTALHIAAQEWKIKERNGAPEFTGEKPFNNLAVILVKCGAVLDIKGRIYYE